jgi:ribosome-associated protein
MTVGKMLRRLDTGTLMDVVNDIDQKNRKVHARFHLIEAWRDRLIEGDKEVLSELMEQNPAINPQMLRQLIRNSNKQARLGKPPTATRKLFKLLRETDEQTPLPPLPSS